MSFPSPDDAATKLLRIQSDGGAARTRRPFGGPAGSLRAGRKPPDPYGKAPSTMTAGETDSSWKRKGPDGGAKDEFGSGFALMLGCMLVCVPIACLLRGMIGLAEPPAESLLGIIMNTVQISPILPREAIFVAWCILVAVGRWWRGSW